MELNCRKKLQSPHQVSPRLSSLQSDSHWTATRAQMSDGARAALSLFRNDVIHPKGMNLRHFSVYTMKNSSPPRRVKEARKPNRSAFDFNCNNDADSRQIVLFLGKLLISFESKALVALTEIAFEKTCIELFISPFVLSHFFAGFHASKGVGEPRGWGLFIYSRRKKNNKLRAALKMCEKSIKMGNSSPQRGAVAPPLISCRRTWFSELKVCFHR